MVNYISPLTLVINHLCDTGLQAGVVGGIGYLYTRVVTQIDPKVGFVCGATAGAISGFFASKGANKISIITAIAGIIFMPFEVCKKLQLPITFKATLLITGAAIVSHVVITKILEYIFLKKLNQSLDDKYNKKPIH